MKTKEQIRIENEESYNGNEGCLVMLIAFGILAAVIGFFASIYLILK